MARRNKRKSEDPVSEKEYKPHKNVRLPHKLDLSRSNNIPWTDNQKILIHMLTHKNKFSVEEQMNTPESLEPIEAKCAFISGVAGTSKTLTAVYCALKLLAEGKIEKIYYVRSAVASSPNQLGFLKGDLDEKMGVYQSPLDDKLQELLPAAHVKTLMDGGFVKMESTCYLRGRNLANCVVIVDESQNLTHDELVTIISRIAEHGRIWFCYDSKQSDLGANHARDMDKFADIFDPETDFENKQAGFVRFAFGIEDIVRSKFCKYVMGKLDKYEESKKRTNYENKNGFDNVKQPKEYSLESETTKEWSPSDN